MGLTSRRRPGGRGWVQTFEELKREVIDWETDQCRERRSGMPVPVHRLPLEEEPLLVVVKVVRLKQAKPVLINCNGYHNQSY